MLRKSLTASLRVIATITGLLLCSQALGRALPDGDLVEYIEARIASGEYVGVIVGYFDETGEYTQGFGRVDKDTGSTPTAQTIFEISSVSKTFTATLLADAVVRGDMSLADAANTYLGPSAQLASFHGRDISLLDLAAHQSGLPNRPASLLPGDEPNPYAETDRADLIAAINAFEPDSEAGTGYRYSAFAYAVLALALSQTYDASFNGLVNTRLTTPLGMDDTVASLDAEQRSRLAVGYTPEGSVAVPLDQGVFRAAGSMYSTLEDLMIWMRLHTSNAQSDLARAARLTHTMRNDTQTIGLAWHRTEGHTDRSQFGTAHGYRAFVGFLADGSRGAVVLANTKANVQDIGLRLLIGAPLAE